MTKRKIGELEGTPIVTGDKNYANEHEYYMTLNGDNTYQKLEQRTNGDQFRLVLGGGSGCDCGIPTIDKNTQPNIVWREPTEEDLAKFHSRLIEKVADLADGKVPLFYVESHPIDPEDPTYDIITVASPMVEMTFPTEEDDGQVDYSHGDIIARFSISGDWSLLGARGVG